MIEFTGIVLRYVLNTMVLFLNVTNLFNVKFLSECIDNGTQEYVIDTDFCKEFNRIDHGILLGKLLKFAILQSYLLTENNL